MSALDRIIAVIAAPAIAVGGWRAATMIWPSDAMLAVLVALTLWLTALRWIIQGVTGEY